MKTLKKIILFISIATLFSCSTNDEIDDTIGGEGTLTAKVSGVDFTSFKASVSAVVTNGILSVQGSNSSGDYIRISISSYNGVGTYKTGDAITNTSSVMYGTISPVAAWSSTFDIGSGSIEITEETATSISGTFTFTGFNGSSDSKQITDGKFNAPKN
ncbi:MAG: DUF6252 family protein [Polaribacter sp.]|uniref:DUF6252 family protein n=1 Tax=Polaribacter sp. TaxID=1920175 RepID=UPI002F357C81